VLKGQYFQHAASVLINFDLSENTCIPRKTRENRFQNKDTLTLRH